MSSGEEMDARQSTPSVEFRRASSIVAMRATRARTQRGEKRGVSISSLPGSPRDTWGCRSTVGAYSDDEEEEEEEDNNERWSGGGEEGNNGDSTDDEMAYDSHRHSGRSNQEEMERKDTRERRAAAEAEATKRVLCGEGAKLRRIPGFSNKEALMARLPARRPLSLPSKPADIERSKEKECGTNFEKKVMLKQQLDPPPRDPFEAKTLEHKIAMHEELTKIQKIDEFHGKGSLPQVESDRLAVTYRMSTMMVYSIVFTSSATLHCAIFNFSLELRRFFRLDMLPFGVFLLVCWTILGLLSFAGGWVGDLVHDRILLLRRTAILWAVAVFVLHLAAFRAASGFSLASVALVLPCSFIAHGIFTPNCIVLGAEKYISPNDRRLLKRNLSSSHTSSDDPEADIPSKFDEERLDDEAALTERLAVMRKIAIHKYFSRCFGATLAGSSCVQLYFFLLVDLEVPLGSSRKSLVGRKGYLCMLLSSLLLLSALICFLFQSRNHFQPPALSLFERKLASLEQDRMKFSWKAVLRVLTRACVGYTLFLSSLVTIAGVCSALIGMLVVPDSSFNLRLTAFLMIVVGWHVTITIGKVQLSAKGNLSAKCRSLGIPILQLQSVLLVVFFLCMSSFSAFLRAQLYTTLVAQMCQTRLDIPGAGDTVLNPNALGALVSIVSLLLIPISNATRFGRRTKAPRGLFAAEYRVVSISPSRRLSIAIFLYLVGIFLSSVVELYRRTKVVVMDPQPKCSKSYSDFGVMWTAPHLVFLGLSDMVFRVSLQEQFHSIDLLTSQWPGLMQGMIEFSEMIGYAGALALTSVLSSWLFRPSTSDLALVLLLMTTLLAFSYSSLKRVAEKIADGHFNGDEVPG